MTERIRSGAIVSCLLAAMLALSAGCGGGNLGTLPDVDRLDPEGAQAAYEQGNEALGRGDRTAAIAAYSQAIELNPNHARAYNNRAIAYILEREGDLAVQDLEAAAALNADLPDVYYNLGNVHLKRGFYREASIAFDRYLELVPDDLQAKNNQAVVVLRLGEVERARQLLLEVLAAEPDNLAALANLGNVHESAGEIEEAFATYQRALDLDPDHPQTLRNLGVLEFRQRMLEPAIAHLERFIELAPDDLEIAPYRGMVRTLRELEEESQGI